MVDKSNEYGFVPSSPTQARGANTGIFEVNDIVDLLNAEQWSGTFGKLEFIETQTVSGSNVVFNDLATNNYNIYLLTLENVVVATNDNYLFVRFSTDNGSTFITSATYNRAYLRGKANGTFNENKAQNQTLLEVAPNLSNVANVGMSGYMYFYNLLDSSNFSYLSHHLTGRASDGVYQFSFGGGTEHTAQTINTFGLDASSGNLSGTFTLYGLKES
jgi:hypothetical protein